MTERTDQSMLLTLSSAETQAMKSIIGHKVVTPRPRIMSPKRWLCVIGAATLIALTLLGFIKPELVRTIAELAGLALTL